MCRLLIILVIHDFIILRKQNIENRIRIFLKAPSIINTSAKLISIIWHRQSVHIHISYYIYVYKIKQGLNRYWWWSPLCSSWSIEALHFTWQKYCLCGKINKGEDFNTLLTVHSFEKIHTNDNSNYVVICIIIFTLKQTLFKAL